MATTPEVTEWLIRRAAVDQDEHMSNLKLQKLLYYAQGWMLALHGRRLFDEGLQSYAHGPVVPSAEVRYRNLHAQALTPDPDSDFDWGSLDPDEEDVLRRVWRRYGSLTAAALWRSTHSEPPWMSTYRDDVKHIKLPDDVLLQFFNDLAAREPLDQVSQFDDEPVLIPRRVLESARAASESFDRWR